MNRLLLLLFYHFPLNKSYRNFESRSIIKRQKLMLSTKCGRRETYGKDAKAWSLES